MYTDLSGRIWTDAQVIEAWAGATAHVEALETEIERLRAQEFRIESEIISMAAMRNAQAAELVTLRQFAKRAITALCNVPATGEVIAVLNDAPWDLVEELLWKNDPTEQLIATAEDFMAEL